MPHDALAALIASSVAVGVSLYFLLKERSILGLWMASFFSLFIIALFDILGWFDWTNWLR